VRSRLQLGSLARLRGRGRVHAGCYPDTVVRQLRDPDAHLQRRLRVGHVGSLRRRGRVRARVERLVRQLWISNVLGVVHVGSLRGTRRLRSRRDARLRELQRRHPDLHGPVRVGSVRQRALHTAGHGAGLRLVLRRGELPRARLQRGRQRLSAMHLGAVVVMLRQRLHLRTGLRELHEHGMLGLFLQPQRHLRRRVQRRKLWALRGRLRLPGQLQPRLRRSGLLQQLRHRGLHRQRLRQPRRPVQLTPPRDAPLTLAMPRAYAR